MEKKECAICGNKLGLFSNYVRTKEDAPLCKSCHMQSHSQFAALHYTLDEFKAHLNQVSEGNHTYETIFKDRLNEKQGEEKAGAQGPLQKNYSVPFVKKYGIAFSCIWAVEDFGLILVNTTRSVSSMRNLVFRYSELESYEYYTDKSYDGNSIDCNIRLNFRSPHPLNSVHVNVSDKNVYNAFDAYFAPIINSDKTEWDRRADAALSRVPRLG